MQDHTSNLLSTYGDPSIAKINAKAKPRSLSKTSIKPSEYNAFGDLGGAHGIRIHYTDGSISTEEWSYFMSAFLSSGEFMTLIFNHIMITIEGENFTENEIDQFRHRKIDYIKPFDAKKFEVEEGEPIIHKITYEHPNRTIGKESN